MTFGRLWTFLAVALPVTAGLLAILSAVDLAYHLRAGGEFLDTGRIATTDTWTHTAAGQPWANQQWGAQVILAAIHRLGGFEALVVFRAAVIGAIFGLVMIAARIRGATPRQAALLSLAAFGVSAAALTLRPQLLGMLLFAASLVLVADRRRHPGRLWLVPILVVAWANLHGSFFLAPLLLGVAWLEDLHDRQPRHGWVLVIAAVAAAAAVLNPLGLGVWTYAIGLSTNVEVTTRISEWQPTTLRSVIGIIFYGSALLVVAFLARRGRSTPWPTLLWLAVLFGIGAYALRGVAWWPLGAAVVVAGLLDRPEPDRVRPERASALNAAVAGLVVVAGVILLPWWRPTVLLEAPAGITAHLRTYTSGVAAFHPQAWGSWIEFDAPNVKTFVDSRIELFDPIVWRDYEVIVEARPDWERALGGVNVVITDDRTGDLAERLDAHPSWDLAYEDDDGKVFLVRGGNPR
jgi:hypothetical protein